MSNIYGPGVGRNLSSKDKQYKSVVFQPGKPPVSEEFNLLTETMDEARKEIIRSNTPSGWISNLFDSKKDYSFDPQASNMFWLGKETGTPTYALVNGWVVPVTGTLTEDARNAILLPPPKSTSQTYFVFLEVWKAQLSPDGTVNKPAEDQVYRYGNVEYGGQNLTNQIPDTRYKEETSERVQLQYRIRVYGNVNPDTSPFGFNSGIRAQGPLVAPISTSDPDFQYQNMGEELGDPGLWRAGVPNEVSENGMSVTAFSPMNTVDGYVYALPICMVFQRASSLWSVSNLGGAPNRNPDAVSREDATVLPTVLLTADIDRDQEIFDVDISQGATTFPTQDGRIKLGNEIIRYQSWIGNTIDATSGRGFAGSHATKHLVDTKLHFVSGNPLGLFSDEVTEDDVHDLRHIVSPSSFSYDAMLKHNFMRLAKGELKTQWKVGEGSTKGLRHFQVDHFSDGAPTFTSALEGDAPDGFRKVFSDASVLQPQNLLVVEKDAVTVSSANYTFNVTSSDIYRNEDAPLLNWETGDNIRVPLDSLRNTFKTANRQKVRFVHPLEYKNSDHSPVRTWFGDQSIADLEEGPEGEMIVLGSKPEGIVSGLVDGLNSTITYDAANPYITIEDASNNPVNFSSVVASLVEQEAYIILEPAQQGAVTPYKGAFKIVGDDGNQGLELELPNGEIPNFSANDYTGNWHIRLRKCKEEDDELYMVLAIPSGEVAPAEFVEQKNLFMTFDVLYHPNQGMGRVPEIPLFTRLERDSGEPYVRPHGFSNLASPSLNRGGDGPRDYPVAPMESYPSARSETRIRNNQDVQTSVEDTWSEVYVDRGSKTVIFQPMQRASVHINADTNPSEPDYAGGPGSETDFNYRLANGSPCYFLPKEVLPPAGRIDVPFQPYALTTEDVPFGLNAIFTAVDAAGTLYNEQIIHNRVLGIYDSQELGAADYDTYIDAVDLDIGESALGCRLYDEGGVRGIELPPHFGIARLMGAYLVDDWDGSQFTSASNYTQIRAGFAGTDVLRKDHVGRSIIITEDNTFVVPEQVLDTELIGTDLASARIVLEFATFMFNDWKADRVQIHVHTPLGDSNISLLMNGPCNANDTFMSVSTRIPYQGNLAGTMGQDFMDYRPKRQVDQVLDIGNVRTPLDQREAELRNPVSLEILATMPFVTTLGTGRVSGKFEDGSYTDTGYISQEGFPDNVVGPRVAKTRTLVGDSDPRHRPDILTGLTERLPTGILASDHLFAGEPFFGDQRSFWLEGGTDLEGFHNENRGGQLLHKNFQEGTVLLSDGTNGGSASSMDYLAGGNLYRTYRGGVLTVDSGKQKGGTFVTSGPRLYKEFPHLKSFEAEYSRQVAQLTQGNITPQEFTSEVQELQAKYQKRLQVHGASLFGIAMLVRTRKEAIGSSVSSYGDELQMLVATGASFGVDASLNQLEGTDPSREILDLLIQLHPTGFGEGYCAADRFRLEGRPLQKESKASSTIDTDHLYRGADPAEDPDPHC